MVNGHRTQEHDLQNEDEVVFGPQVRAIYYQAGETSIITLPLQLPPSLPTSQNRLCLIQLYEHAGQLVDAGWVYVSLAWVSDDSASVDRAQSYRLLAVHCFEQAIASGTKLSSEPGADALFLSDLLRRAGSFERALAYCVSGLSVVEDKAIQGLLQYEKTLVDAHDLRCHTVPNLAEAG